MAIKLFNNGLKAVIFDMDGVLVNTEGYWFEIFRSLVNDYGKELTEEDRKELYGCSEEKEADVLSRYIPLSKKEISLKRDRRVKERPMDYGKLIFPGARELLEYLHSKGIKLAIASSSKLIYIIDMVKSCDIEKYFTCLKSGVDLEETKPNPKIYLDTIEALGVNKDNIIIVEDSPYGFEAGINSGTKTIVLANDVLKFDTSKAVYVAKDHYDLKKYFEKILEEKK